MLIVTGIITVSSLEDVQRARPAIAQMVAETMQEDGCIAYDFWQHPEDPTRFRVYEEWRDRPALDAHSASAHMGVFRAALAKLGPMTRDLVTIEAGTVRPL